MDTTHTLFIGRPMRGAEAPGEASPEMVEAQTREVVRELEAEFAAKDRWLALGRPGAHFWAWHEEKQRRAQESRQGRLGWNLAACLGVALWLLIVLPNALAVLATAATGLALLSGLLLSGAVIMLPVVGVRWLRRKGWPQAAERPR